MGDTYFVVPVAIVAVLAAAFVLCGYLLILPAAAIGEKISLRRSREFLTENNF